MKQQHRARCVREMVNQGGLAEGKAGILVDAGYPTGPHLRSASNEDLLAIEGIGSVTVRKVREWAGGPE